MSKLRQALMMTLLGVAAMQGESGPFDAPRIIAKKQDSKPIKIQQKQLHEFIIHGEKIMAYSHKDAIKRYGKKKQ